MAVQSIHRLGHLFSYGVIPDEAYEQRKYPQEFEECLKESSGQLSHGELALTLEQSFYSDEEVGLQLPLAPYNIAYGDMWLVLLHGENKYIAALLCKLG